MQIVIDLPEESYKATCDGCMLPPDVDSVVQGIKKGTPLPSGHGGLIYAEDAIETLQLMFARDKDIQNACEQCILDCPTIIEADTESEEVD